MWGAKPHKASKSHRNSVDGFCCRMKRRKRGIGNAFFLFPVFGKRNATAKNPNGQGFKSGDFFAPFAKKYYSSLDGLDSRNGRRKFIAQHLQIWYNVKMELLVAFAVS